MAPRATSSKATGSRAKEGTGDGKGKRGKTESSAAAGKGKGKAKARAETDAEEEEEEEDNGERTRGKRGKRDKTGEIAGQTMSTLRDDAWISLNKINFLELPVPLKFGTWNARDLHETKVDTLVKSFVNVGYQGMRIEHALSLVMKKSHFDETVQNASLRGEDIPFLKLTEEGMKALAKRGITAAGGQHRQAATGKYRIWLRDEIEKMEMEIAAREGATTNELAAFAKETGVTLEKLRQRLKDRVEELSYVGIWLVRVFDEEIALADDALLARDLSNNDVIPHNESTPSERLVQSFKEMRRQVTRIEKLGESEATRANTLDAEALLVAKSDKKLAGFLRQEGVLKYLGALVDTNAIFESNEVTLPKWVERNIMNVGGGIIIELVVTGAGLWKGLLSPDPLWVCDPKEPERTKLFEAVRDKPEGTRTKKESEDYDTKVKATWERLKHPKIESQPELMTKEFFSAIDAHGKAAFEKLAVFVTPKTMDDTMNRYWMNVEKTVKRYITRVPRDGQLGKVGEYIESKVEWMYNVDAKPLIPRGLPLLTPSAVADYGIRWSTMTLALEECVSWLLPIALYIAHAGNRAEEKSGTTLLFRHFRNHPDFEERGDELVAAIINFLCSRRRALYAMEQGLRGVLKQVPSMFHAKKTTGWDFTVMRLPEELQSKADNAVIAHETTLKNSNLQGRFVAANIPRLWPLKIRMVDGDFGADSKSAKRDRTRWIRLAVFEVARVAAYRANFIKTCRGVAEFREELARIVDDHIRKDQSELTQAPDGNAHFKAPEAFWYPDGLRVSEGTPLDGPTKKAAEPSSEEMTLSTIAIDQALPTRFWSMLVKSERGQVSPNDRSVHPDVAKKFDEFQEALRLNQGRLHKMRQEANMDRVDPYHAKFNVTAEEVAPISFKSSREIAAAPMVGPSTTSPGRDLEPPRSRSDVGVPTIGEPPTTEGAVDKSEPGGRDLELSKSRGEKSITIQAASIPEGQRPKPKLRGPAPGQKASLPIKIDLETPDDRDVEKPRSRQSTEHPDPHPTPMDVDDRDNRDLVKTSSPQPAVPPTPIPKEQVEPNLPDAPTSDAPTPVTGAAGELPIVEETPQEIPADVQSLVANPDNRSTSPLTPSPAPESTVSPLRAGQKRRRSADLGSDSGNAGDNPPVNEAGPTERDIRHENRSKRKAKSTKTQV